MKIKWLQKIRNFLEYRKLKKLEDKELKQKLEKKLEENETDNIGNVISHVEENEQRLDLAKKVIESEINEDAKRDVIDKLPTNTRKQLFIENIQTKEILAKKDKDTFLEMITTQKNLHPYDEIYYRLDKAFSDQELDEILQKIQDKRPEKYDEEKILRIIGKQMALHIMKSGVILPYGFKEILDNNVLIEETKENREKVKNKFNLLDSRHVKKLEEALNEEVENLKEKNYNNLNKIQEEYLSQENLNYLISRLIDFEKTYIEKVNQQNMGLCEKEEERE